MNDEAVNDKARRIALVTMLAEAFNRELSDGALKLYLGALDDAPVQKLERSAEICMRTSRFFPSAAELRESAGHAVPSRDDRAIRAWAEAWEAVTDLGSYVSVVFADPVTSRTVAVMGGWPAFCRPAQSLEWHRKEFLETYRGLESCEGELDVRQLAGLHERAGGRVETVVVGQLPARHRLPSSQSERADDSRLMAEIRRRAKESEGDDDVACSRIGRD